MADQRAAVALACCVQLPQVVSPAPVASVPSRFDPVRMSCMFGVSPRPLTAAPFSVSEFSLPSLVVVAVQVGDVLRPPARPWRCTRDRCRSGPSRSPPAGRPRQRAQVGAPGATAGARRRRQRLAMRVGAARPPRLAPSPDARAGDEEAERAEPACCTGRAPSAQGQSDHRQSKQLRRIVIPPMVPAGARPAGQPVVKVASAFGRRCIPPRSVTPPSNTAGILGRRALRSGRITGLGASPPLPPRAAPCGPTVYVARGRSSTAAGPGSCVKQGRKMGRIVTRCHVHGPDPACRIRP